MPRDGIEPPHTLIFSQEPSPDSLQGRIKSVSALSVLNRFFIFFLLFFLFITFIYTLYHFYSFLSSFIRFFDFIEPNKQLEYLKNIIKWVPVSFNIFQIKIVCQILLQQTITMYQYPKLFLWLYYTKFSPEDIRIEPSIITIDVIFACGFLCLLYII